MNLVHYKKGNCSGTVRVKVTPLFDIVSKIGITTEGITITSICPVLIKDSLEDAQISIETLEYHCNVCKDLVPINELMTECSGCYNYKDLSELVLIEGAGGRYCANCAQRYIEDGNKTVPLLECMTFIKEE